MGKINFTNLRVQLWIIATAYIGVFVLATGLLVERYVWERLNAAEVVAESGMTAAGDTLLWLFLACLFMIPTFFLVWVMAKYENLYNVYSQILLGISLTAPFCLLGIYLGDKHIWQYAVDFCFFRFLFSPFILTGIGFSRWMAKFGRAKRLTSYALLIEGLTIAIAVTLIFHAAKTTSH